MTELLNNLESITSEIDRIMPQLSQFITQFYDLIESNNVNVITDGKRNLSIDVPNEMATDVAERLSTRIGVMDRLINTHKDSLTDLFQRGSEIENTIKTDNQNFTSKLNERASAFEVLKHSYRH